jgi:hypothetical protein
MNIMVGPRGESRRRAQRVAVEFTAWLSLEPGEETAAISSNDESAAENGSEDQSAPR